MERREFLERFVFVRKCGGCGEILPYERSQEAFCVECAHEWHKAKAENCPECLRVVTECTCAPRGLRGVHSLKKLMFYHPKKHKEPQNKIIYLLKHRPNRRISAFVAKELAPSIRASLTECGVSEPMEDVLIISVPRGRRSKTLYGFDQSELICKELATYMGLTYVSAIVRARGGREQKGLAREKRFGNVKGAFSLRKGVELSGKYLVLFDDIVTTGASMSGCVPMLQKAGAKEILAFCIAQDQPKQKKSTER